MESRLPKPTGLKRPMTIAKPILPMDRIKTTGAKIGTINGSLNSISNYVPLSRDLSNFPSTSSLFNKKERAQSPDLERPNNFLRPKLRRSRSACDIQDFRTRKRMEPTLAPIPSKAPRLISSTIASGKSAAGTNSLTATRFLSSTTISESSSLRNGGVASSSTSHVAAGTFKRNIKAPVAPTAKFDTIKKVNTLSSSLSSTSTHGATKTINKRIPPYDFKARFHDLLEKHKSLKEKYEETKEQLNSFETLPEQYEESQTQLIKTSDDLRKAKLEIECFERQVNSQNMKIDSLTSSLQTTSEELEKLKDKYEKLSSEQFVLNEEVLSLRERTARLLSENTELISELDLCKDQLFRSNIERKELHNAVMDLRGNIRVFCRVRPPLDFEESKPLCGWNYIDEATLEITNLDLLGSRNKISSHTFSFDHVFHPRSKQEDIFEMVSPLIQSALDGYNICIFAYGQTGSGKTYTMDGISTNAGVIPRTVDLLFDSVESYKRLGWEYVIKATFLEIYNEVLYDLLSNEQKEMDIRMATSNKNDIYVTNIREETVTNAGRLRHLMQIAKMNRATAATASNDRSSRSHAVTKIEVIGTHLEKNEISIGTINLVDLAGSESPKTSIRMNETKNINRSLSELTNVILALLQKQDHIPYRNSKLTHLLMPSLGGNSKTLMFINVAPFQDCFVESLKSLRFAASVNSCKMAKAKRNKFLNTSSGGSFS